MKKLLRILGVLVLLVLVVIGGAITYVTQALPNIEAPTDLKVEITGTRDTRGVFGEQRVRVHGLPQCA